MVRFVALLAALTAGICHSINVGDSIPPNLELHHGFPPKKIKLAEYIADRQVILMGLPGAFTPT